MKACGVVLLLVLLAPVPLIVAITMISEAISKKHPGPKTILKSK